VVSRIVLIALSCTAAFAQNGVAPEWDVRSDLRALVDYSKRLKTTLDKIHPKDWIAKGAPEAYVTQQASLENEVKYLAWSSDQFSKDPEKLSAGLDTLFRLQALELLINSLAEGVQRYQNPAIADQLRGQIGENAATRDKLRRYLVDLAATKEQECKVMASEAQRCRLMISKQPAPSAAQPTKKRE
jgi:hypothetical protein